MESTAACPSPPRRLRAFAPAWLVLAVGWLISVMAAGWFWREAEQVDRARFFTTVTNLVEQLDARTERYAEQLERFGDLIEAKQDVTEAEWNELVLRLQPRSNFPAFWELAYATNAVLPSRASVVELQYTEPRLPSRGSPRLEVVRNWLNGTVLTLRETRLWLHTARVKECWWGTANGRLRSSPRRLVTRTNDGPAAAVSLFVPVVASDFFELNEFRPDDSWMLRRLRFKGVVIGTIGWQALIETALPSANNQVAFEAFADTADTGKISADSWMGIGGGAESQVLKSGFNPRFQHTHGWPFYRNQWQLVFYSTKQFDLQSTRYRAWVALAGGVILSSMMAGVLAVQVRARLRQEVISHQLRSALDDLDAARRERERLSHDLHDGTIQSLYALQLGLSRAGEQALSAQPALGARLAEYRRNLTAIIGELRGYILRHEADESPQGDLAGVLAAVVERLRSTTETELHAQLSPEAAQRLTGEQAVHLANLAREALSNALRHAHARRISVALRDEPDRVTLEITDDGCGFDPAQPPHTGLGLTSMASRAREAGGELHVVSRHGEGTLVRVVVAAERRASLGTDTQEYSSRAMLGAPRPGPDH